MKSKIHKNGGFAICLFTILLFCHESQIINPVTAAHISSLSIQSEQSQTDINQQGILDRAYNKIKQKQEQEEMEENVKLLQQQDNFLKASRQAILMSHGENPEEAQLMLKNMRMAGNLPNQKSQASYDEQIKKIASKQDEYKDEYEGYGSLTEMIKHQENMADEAAKKANEMAQAKAKLKEALDGPKKKEQPIQEVAAPVAASANSSANTGTTPASTNQTAQAQASSNSSDSSNKTEPMLDKDGKLSDQQVAQVIEEVSIEQEASEPAPGQPAQTQSSGEDEGQFQGFIGKYTQKLSDKDKKESEPASSTLTIEEEQPAAKPKKGMRARFEERVALDQKDEEKAQETIERVQHAVELKKKSVLEQETERIVREQHDELSLELAAEGTGTPASSD